MVAEFEPREAALTAPDHVAIIMDGNGRWATNRGLPRSQGHRKGVEAVRRAVRAADEIGIKTLTLFAFSSENWNRPKSEVKELLRLLKFFIRRDLADLHKEGVRISIIGARHNVPDDILRLLEEAENLTRDNSNTRLVIAFNYGARDEMARVAQAIARRVEDGELRSDQIDEHIIASHLDTAGWADPDLIIRTSGEQRLSNFLLWQAAYSEFVFLDCLWPDFEQAHLEDAIAQFNRRTRRFGGLVQDDEAQRRA